MATITVYSPVSDNTLDGAEMAPRRPFREGARIVLIDNGKPKAKELLTYIAEAVSEQHGRASVELYSKRAASEVLADAVAQDIASRSDFVLVGLGD